MFGCETDLSSAAPRSKSAANPACEAMRLSISRIATKCWLPEFRESSSWAS